LQTFLYVWHVFNKCVFYLENLRSFNIPNMIYNFTVKAPPSGISSSLLWVSSIFGNNYKTGQCVSPFLPFNPGNF